MADSTINVLIYVLLITLVGFAMLLFLKNIIANSNINLVKKYSENNMILNEDIRSMFNGLLNKMQEAQIKNTAEVKLFTEYLKKETDKYSETTSKFRNTIFSINEDLKELSQTNRELIKGLRETTLKEIKNNSETLRSTTDALKSNQTVFTKNMEAIIELLKGFQNAGKIIEQSDKNLSMILKLNSNHDELINKFKETLVQIKLVTDSISNVAEGRLKPLFQEVQNIIPDIRKEAAYVSSDLYGKFSESLDKLDKLSNNLNEITNKYNLLLEGNRKDPITGEYLT